MFSDLAVCLEMGFACVHSSFCELDQATAFRPCAPLLPLFKLCGQPRMPKGDERAKPVGIGVQVVLLAQCHDPPSCPA